MSDEQVNRELRELVQLVAELSSNHKAALENHEENLKAAHNAVNSHAQAIEE